MRSNLTILEQNTLLALEHDDTQELYLKGAQKNELAAFNMALEWQEMLRPFLHAIIPQECEVIDFIRERQFRRYFPNQ